MAPHQRNRSLASPRSTAALPHFPARRRLATSLVFKNLISKIKEGFPLSPGTAQTLCTYSDGVLVRPLPPCTLVRMVGRGSSSHWCCRPTDQKPFGHNLKEEAKRILVFHAFFRGGFRHSFRHTFSPTLPCALADNLFASSFRLCPKGC